MDFKKVIGSGEQVKVYPSIGPVSYKRNLRAKRISIRIKRTGEVKVTIPNLSSFRVAEEFVLSKSFWISQKIKEIETHKQNIIANGFATRAHVITFKSSKSDNIVIKFGTPNVEIEHPETLHIQHASIQDTAKRAIERAYRTEAQEYLPERISVLAQQKGFKFNKLTIRNSFTRWGSCSAKNNINLSLHLMKLPNELIDYVILHELCHTVQKNHGPKFWELLNLKTDGQAKLYAKEVKKYSTKF
ncbi:hypothetical protein CYCD_27210 [Tenuifilaceae bacterium CYCD]|nr:hypothetical protein CYCD_27210 [Tenuifilaceae bacterium CYCD]